MSADDGFIELRLNRQDELAGENFWPSFTDIMTVVVMIFWFWKTEGGGRRMKKEIRICGFGGQGVILAGFIIGKAAAVFMNYNAVQSQSYGPEARGGAARSEVIISDEKIGYPRPTSVDVLIAMSQESFDAYRNDIRDDTRIVVDPDLVTKHNIGRPIYKVHAQQIAEKLGNKIVTNIVMVGAATSILGLLEPEAVKKAVIDSVPSRFKELNVMAFEKGLEAGNNALKEK